MVMTSARRFPVEEIGVFLCDYPLREPFEFVDMPNEREIRQDAALRALVALRKLNLLASDDPVTAFNAQPRIVALSYRWARIDAVRAHLGRGKQTRPVQLRELPELLADSEQEVMLSAVESDATAEIRRYEEFGLPSLTLEQTRRVFTLMRQVQNIKAHQNPIPDALRKQLSRLRKETGLPLDVRLL
jgi:hypothetical protein